MTSSIVTDDEIGGYVTLSIVLHVLCYRTPIFGSENGSDGSGDLVENDFRPRAHFCSSVTTVTWTSSWRGAEIESSPIHGMICEKEGMEVSVTSLRPHPNEPWSHRTG